MSYMTTDEILEKAAPDQARSSVVPLGEDERTRFSFMDGLSEVYLNDLSPRGLNGVRAEARTFLSSCEPGDMCRLRREVSFARAIVAILGSELPDRALRSVVQFAEVHSMNDAVREAFYALVVALKGASARERAMAGEVDARVLARDLHRLLAGRDAASMPGPIALDTATRARLRAVGEDGAPALVDVAVVGDEVRLTVDGLTVRLRRGAVLADFGHAIVSAAAGDRLDDTVEPWNHTTAPLTSDELARLTEAAENPRATSRGHKRTIRAVRRLLDEVARLRAGPAEPGVTPENARGGDALSVERMIASDRARGGAPAEPGIRLSLDDARAVLDYVRRCVRGREVPDEHLVDADAADVHDIRLVPAVAHELGVLGGDVGSPTAAMAADVARLGRARQAPLARLARLRLLAVPVHGRRGPPLGRATERPADHVGDVHLAVDVARKRALDGFADSDGSGEELVGLVAPDEELGATGGHRQPCSGRAATTAR